MKLKILLKASALCVLALGAYEIYIMANTNVLSASNFQSLSLARKIKEHQRILSSSRTSDTDNKKKLISCDSHFDIMPKSIKPNYDDNSKPDCWKCPKVQPKVAYLNQPTILQSDCIDDACIKSKKISWRMFTFVKSKASNFARREALRRTWASVKYINGGRFYTIFVVGRTDNDTQLKINKEIERRHDILQINASDDYRSSIDNTLAGMQWASENLADSCFYSTTNDETLLKLRVIHQSVTKYINISNTANWTDFPILCLSEIGWYAEPSRIKGNAYYSSVEEYAWPYYPNFCVGGMYTTSVKVTNQLWEISRIKTPFVAEDIWISGILRAHLGLPDAMLIQIQPAAFAGFRAKPDFETVSFFKQSFREWKRNSLLFATDSDMCLCRDR